MKVVEKLYDENGTLLMEAPYPFKRLFKKGQEQTIRGVSMTILSCIIEGEFVLTKVRLHGPWPNATLRGGKEE
jgi:hypothetical protein